MPTKPLETHAGTRLIREPIGNTAALRGRVFDIQRFSIHDGPGIRTTVFLKGCPLRCLWCHNPEGMDAKPALSFLPERCIGCGYCLRACPQGAHRLENGVHVLDRVRCRACGTCAAECYAGALELIGRELTVTQVLEEVLPDRPFYETSGGGLTLSGGEPLLQLAFTHALLQAARAAELHCCVETCGFAPWEHLQEILPLVNLWLYDIKDTDSERHRRHTGVPNEVILRNLRCLHAAGALVRLRVPLIPGYNDHADNLEGLVALARELPGLQGIELLPYHNLGTAKHARLGTSDPLRHQPPPDRPAPVAEWSVVLRQHGLKVLNPA